MPILCNKKIDIEITKSIKGTKLTVDGQEIKGISKIKLEVVAEAGGLWPYISLEFCWQSDERRRAISVY